jgi:hypothetical protein
LSCHNTKETDDSANQDTLAKLKRSAFTKATSTIDTVDYNKRIVALITTTGRWPVKTPYPLPGALLPYHRIIAFTEIYIQNEWGQENILVQR